MRLQRNALWYVASICLICLYVIAAFRAVAPVPPPAVRQVMTHADPRESLLWLLECGLALLGWFLRLFCWWL